MPRASLCWGGGRSVHLAGFHFAGGELVKLDVFDVAEELVRGVQVALRTPTPSVVPMRRTLVPVGTGAVGAAASGGFGYVLEADLTTIGDHVTLQGVLQTHLFEDRVMKLGTVYLGEGASIGGGSFVLYDSHVGTEAILGDLSMCMKGETFLPGHCYRGLPAENVPQTQLVASPVARKCRKSSYARPATMPADFPPCLVN